MPEPRSADPTVRLQAWGTIWRILLRPRSDIGSTGRDRKANDAEPSFDSLFPMSMEPSHEEV